MDLEQGQQKALAGRRTSTKRNNRSTFIETMFIVFHEK